jgi:hypothetical protein
MEQQQIEIIFQFANHIDLLSLKLLDRGIKHIPNVKVPSLIGVTIESLPASDVTYLNATNYPNLTELYLRW